MSKIRTYADLSASLRKCYSDLDERSKEYPLELVDGVLRFKANRAVQFAANVLMENRPGPCFNELWVEATQNHWPTEEVRQFYREMGYSLCGFLDVFQDKGETL